jgi:hypothetical protein
MKESKIIESKKEPRSWILPGNSLTQDEFLHEIYEAEKGPFMSVEESMENFELWLKLREKK